MSDFLATPVTYGSIVIFIIGWTLARLLIILWDTWDQKRRFNKNVTEVKDAIQISNFNEAEIKIESGTKSETWEWKDGGWTLKQI